MAKEKLLDLDAVLAQEREGLQFEGTLYPWAMVGPIEQARFIAMQQEIRDVSSDEANLTVEAAGKIVQIQRDLLKLILPTLPDEVASHIHDEQVSDIIRFFDLSRTRQAVDNLEEQMEPAERANKFVERAQTIGASMSPRSNDSTKGSRRPGWSQDTLPYLRSYIEMMPVLQARESLMRIAEISVGTGSLKKSKSREIMRALRRAANPRGHRDVEKPGSREEHNAKLASLGIPVKES